MHPIPSVTEVETLLDSGKSAIYSRDEWLSYLNLTGRASWLRTLPSGEMRVKWAENVFRILQLTNFSLLDLLQQRVSEHPHRILFSDMSSSPPVDWTYLQISHHLREIAATFLGLSNSPRVALYTENCLEGACSDLACLSYGIFITPLSPHFKSDVLRNIFDRLEINIALADSEERLQVLSRLRDQTQKPFRILSLTDATGGAKDTDFLPEACKRNPPQEIERILEMRPPFQYNQVATTMFTSGSTGMPKGVSFSVYNIVSKRFARAAALPEIDEQTFLCYLPLYHTFGRYLEMTGAIYWHGTYVFAGNTSAETLLNLFPKINPTGFISIPLRWLELYEKCSDRIAGLEHPGLRQAAVREVVGQRLSWGLSAAGYLDPKVFRFFNSFGISLCSGFGMTEATGGITMTPPGQYREGSVGIPLPGVYTRLNDDSELELSGHYIARYLEDAGPGDIIPVPGQVEPDYRMPTGDVFRVTDDGFHEIVDRVKDIYKNNKGQTVAPAVVEKKFTGVPGFRQTFLVGDNRPYNVLLIVPDTTDSLYQSLTGNNREEYFHGIIMAVNSEVAPYERVINFSLLDRDFDREHGELTPKGSFNRKVIEKNFLPLIESLYSSNTISLQAGEFTILIPKWFYRDLGILESDILFKSGKLFNRRTRTALPVRRSGSETVSIGDFSYQIAGNTIDIGVLTRQPRLWVGNSALIRFCPVREGWDLDPGAFNLTVRLRHFIARDTSQIPALTSIRNIHLQKMNDLIMQAYSSPSTEAIAALEHLGGMFPDLELKMADLLRQRLEVLAYHPEEEIRVLAYRLILLKAPRPELIPQLPAFIESGKSFLNEESIRIIASGNLGKHRLDALKQRLYFYRTHLKWPASRKTRSQFTDVLNLLYSFALNHLDFYVPVRAELSRWILHRQDRSLSRRAEELFNQLANSFESRIEKRFPSCPVEFWNKKLVFEHGISDHVKKRILEIFKTSTFFQESVLLTFNEWDFSLDEVPDHGIWILRMVSFKEFLHFRLSINTVTGKHFDLHMVMSEKPGYRPKPDTFYWLASLAGFPYGPSVAPLLGSSRPGLGVLTTQLIGGLTAWDKIREIAAIHQSAGHVRTNAWKKIFIQAFSVVFKAWHHSGYQIVPGAITPVNIAIPEMDFRESAVILSLAGWSDYQNTLSLVEPMIQDFYCRTAALYPLSRKELKIRWIFDACIEALGKTEASSFLARLYEETDNKKILCFDNFELKHHLETYLKEELNNFYFPLALYNAIDQYADWIRMNPLTTATAREQTLMELMELYRLRHDPAPVRYCFYRYTYFTDKPAPLKNAFDRLLNAMKASPMVLPVQHLELSELQAEINDADDKMVFTRMVFPRLQGKQRLDLVRIGDKSSGHLVVRFQIQDEMGRHYLIREPVEPREIGQLYQLFFREKYPKEILKEDHQLVVTDEDERVIGGVTWRYLEEKQVLLDGIVVTSSLQGRGLARAMMENFFTTMSALDISLVKAHFLFGNYFMKHYFDVDEKWGALVKVLQKEDE